MLILKAGKCSSNVEVMDAYKVFSHKISNSFLSLLVFNVQATDFPEYKFKLEVEEEISAQNKKKNGEIPGKFTHDEILMDANSNPDVLSSIGRDCPFICSY